MSVRLDGDTVRIEGEGRVEDAEPLLSLLAGGERAVDLSAAGPLHAAVVQALLALRPPLAAPPSDPFTNRWLLPFLSAAPLLAAGPKG